MLVASLKIYNSLWSANGNIRKSSEKLSSMLKINRSADDAAGLAISEKMKAASTMTRGAMHNVKDGISLVQTAEGAMEEIQDMLRRLVKLSDQSANSTYMGNDRENLQKEVEKLKNEIDRIANSANFNGIKLLDGSLDGPLPEEEITALARMVFGQAEDLPDVSAYETDDEKEAGKSKKSSKSSDSGSTSEASQNTSDGALPKSGDNSGSVDNVAARGVAGRMSSRMSYDKQRSGTDSIFQAGESQKGSTEKRMGAVWTGAIDFDTIKDGSVISINGVKFEFDTNETQFDTNAVRVAISATDDAATIENNFINAVNDNESRIYNAAGWRPTVTGNAQLSGNNFCIKDSATGKIKLTQSDDYASNGNKFDVQNSSAGGSGSGSNPNYKYDSTLKIREVTNISVSSIRDGVKLELKNPNTNSPFEVTIRVVSQNTANGLSEFYNRDKGEIYVVNDPNGGSGSNPLTTSGKKGYLGTALNELLKDEGLKGSWGNGYNVSVTKNSDNPNSEMNITIMPSGAGIPSFDPLVIDKIVPVNVVPDLGSVESAEAAAEGNQYASAKFTIDFGALQNGDQITFTVKSDKDEATCFVFDSEGKFTDNDKTKVIDISNLADIPGDPADPSKPAQTVADQIKALFEKAIKEVYSSKYDVTFNAGDGNSGKYILTIKGKSYRDEEITAEMAPRPDLNPPVPLTPSKPPTPPESPNPPTPPEPPNPPTPPEPPAKTGKCLKLQVGEGSSGILCVAIENLTTKGLKIDAVNISTQEDASGAIDVLCNAINKVSSNRGTLGAIQNRLEHTYNSLGVTNENLTDAENKISGTDVAQEMMRLTKKQIIQQAAQSMLAQSMNMERQAVQQLLSF